MAESNIENLQERFLKIIAELYLPAEKQAAMDLSIKYDLELDSLDIVEFNVECENEFMLSSNVMDDEWYREIPGNDIATVQDAFNILLKYKPV